MSVGVLVRGVGRLSHRQTAVTVLSQRLSEKPKAEIRVVSRSQVVYPNHQSVCRLSTQVSCYFFVGTIPVWRLHTCLSGC